MAGHGHFIQPWLGAFIPWLYSASRWWTVLGLVGNFLFSSRFVFQWLASEKRHTLVVPPYFWHLSFWGSVLNLLYALHLDNAPILFGVFFLPFLYGRNLVLLHHSRNKTEVLAPATEHSGYIFKRPAVKAI